jgi:DNA (cytosine-5)-methyltransferase 1
MPIILKSRLQMDKRTIHSEFRSIFEAGSRMLEKWGQDAYESCANVDVLDFFCCAGGMSLGFAVLKNYFKVIGGIDINPISLAAYQDNYHVPTLQADISKLGEDIKKIQNTFNVSADHKNPLVIIGCAPCQGFSAHRKRHYDKPEDSRNTLIGEFAAIAVKFNPDYVVMENVPEILTGKYKHHYQEAKAVFESYSYRIVQKIYNAAGFGVPQARTRAIIVATKSDSFELPVELLSEKEYKTVRDAIGDLPPVMPGMADPKDALHRCSAHKQSTIEVIASVPHNGGSRPEGVGPQCLDKVKGFYDVYGRLSWDKPSITITQYARNPASGRFSHPEQNRGLTIREAARLQSFPDGYKWHGSLGENFKQIGEAVPPLLSLAIASQIAVTIKQEKYGESI